VEDKKTTQKENRVRRRGGQAGNQNARKHGFYSKTMTAAEEKDFEKAITEEGIENEIALLRVKLSSALKKDPGNVRLVMEAARTLVALLSEGKKLTAQEKKTMKARIGEVVTESAGSIMAAAVNNLLKRK
jgi:hypothetical protein